MESRPDPNRITKSSEYGFVWLLVGLLPIPILLSVFSAKGEPPAWPNPVVLLIFCVACNLVGGIGCLSSVKNVAVRIICGILLACVLFAMNLVVVVFQACSHMH
jgi:hypothetical protein